MKREHSLDFLKGIAVLLMIITHVVAFFHDYSDPALNAISVLGATVCFTVFLFSYGALLPLTTLKRVQDDSSVLERYKKPLVMLGVYYILSFGILAITGKITEPLDLLKILFFAKIPLLVEFILAFIIYAFLSVSFAKPLLKLLKKPFLMMVLGLLIYGVGILLYQIDFASMPLAVKAVISLLWGYKNWHRFPILLYTPVFFSGMVFGQILLTESFEKVVKKLWLSFSGFLVMFMLNLLVLFIGILVVSDFGKINEYLLLSRERFPPSPRFIIIGLIFVFSTLLLYFGVELSVLNLNEISRKFVKRIFGFVTTAINLLGMNVFGYFIVHTVLLYIVDLLFEIRIMALWEGLLAMWIVAVLSGVVLFLGNVIGRFFVHEKSA